MYLAKNIISYASLNSSKQLLYNSTICSKTDSQKRSAHKKICNEDITLSTLQEATKDGRVKCTLIPGDGIGPELVRSVEQVFQAVKIPVDFERFLVSEVNPKTSAPLEDVIKSIKKNKICLQGILSTPASESEDLLTLNIRKRRALKLFANVIHIKSLPKVKCKFSNVDCIIIREQTEGEYSALEHRAVPGVIESLKIITRMKSRRIAKFAFDYAVKMGRKRVTAVHKANIMKLGDGLFLRSCKEMSLFYPRVKYDSVIVDNCTMQLVSRPDQYDVLVAPNLYGDVLSSAAAGLVGGAGVVAGASYSTANAIFEQGARHVYAEAANKNVVNPTGILLASVNMLKHINLQPYANQLETAIMKVLNEGKVQTIDIGGTSSTQDFTNAVIQNYPCKT